MSKPNHLVKYIAQHNWHAMLFGRKQLDANRLTAADRAQLRDSLESALSPENLCCDGELRGAPLAAKARMLNGAMAELLKQEAK